MVPESDIKSASLKMAKKTLAYVLNIRVSRVSRNTGIFFCLTKLNQKNLQKYTSQNTTLCIYVKCTQFTGILFPSLL